MQTYEEIKGGARIEENLIILFATRTCKQTLARFIRESFQLRETLNVRLSNDLLF